MFRSSFNKKGFTLVEVIVSVMLVSLVIAAVLGVVLQSAIFSKRIDQMYTSSNLAKHRMDGLKRLNFSDLISSAVETDTRIDEYGEADSSGDYFRTTEITEDFDSNPYLTKIKVSVDREVDEAAAGSPVVLETLFADIE